MVLKTKFTNFVPGEYDAMNSRCHEVAIQKINSTEDRAKKMQLSRSEYATLFGQKFNTLIVSFQMMGKDIYSIGEDVSVNTSLSCR